MLAFFASCAELAACGGIDQIRILGPQAVNLWKLEAQAARSHGRTQAPAQGALLVQDAAPRDTLFPASAIEESENELARKFRAHWFEQPLDHFAEANATETWRQRYWVNTRHYVPGPSTPVFVLDGGETSGVDRLPFLDTGIMEILARATGGVGIVLEHRCVGQCGLFGRTWATAGCRLCRLDTMVRSLCSKRGLGLTCAVSQVVLSL